MAHSEFVNQYLDLCEFQQNKDLTPSFPQALETRTRKGDMTDALRFRIYDPLWMLSRQWQLGEFKGNDAGTAMSVRCRVKQSSVLPGTHPAQFDWGRSGGPLIKPLEYDVEKLARTITPLVRVESAAYFMDMLYDCKEYPTASDRKKLLGTLCSELPLSIEETCDPAVCRSSIESESVRSFSESRNTRLTRFKVSHEGKAFDGLELFLRLQSGGGKDAFGIPQDLGRQYADWFEHRYLDPARKWETDSLSYSSAATTREKLYQSENYSGGNLSWYSFDAGDDLKSTHPKDIRELKAIPSPATYPGAPNKRLWEFEDRKVFMGNSTGMQAKGNVAFLQYATMYGNDWMIFPLKVEFGQYLDVQEIVVYDSFGQRSVITRQAFTEADTFGQQWQMFTNAPLSMEKTGNPQRGLLFVPVFPRKLEGEPLEQVNLLRDEMANMVWGVETRIEDGCGSSLDANVLAAEVGQFVEDSYEEAVEKARLSVRVEPDGRARMTSDRKADFKYTLMTGVPFNWIPFVPQHVKTQDEKDAYSSFIGGREVVLRRGKMPVYFDGKYYPVRPLSSLLCVETGKSKDGKVHEMPLFIHEEEVQGVGTQIVRNCQRARWLRGQTFTWMGYTKQIKYTQGNSGLKFDDLEDPAK